MKKIFFIVAAVLVVLGAGCFVFTKYHPNNSSGTTFPDTYYGVSAAQYSGGTVLYVLNPSKDTHSTACGDTANARCEGSLYEITGGKLTQVASNVVGHEVIYYKPGVKALLQSSFGDGSCRETKFYTYDFATATSSLSFSADNNCDISETKNTQYQKAMRDYLSQFGL